MSNSIQQLIGRKEMTRQTLAQIDDIIASCDGDARGALRVLMLINQRLRLEVAELQQAVDCDATDQPRLPQRPSLH
jgi:hypothetical protein